ncbi:putative Sugar phosphate exchanger 2 [Senna tora]|uniref:Putative Sugar phosphate exchanger 2 n=1 Tax=Senna tora TaxID=362788 RepID=A0A834W1R4_9FABA|nr:putative Sugar phosphate exchanger 2 [Senna tora]
MYRNLHGFPVTRRNSDETDQNGDVAVSFADTVFGFWDDVKSSSENSSNSGDSDQYEDEEEEEEDDENFSTVQQNTVFWEEQDQLLQATLCRTTSIESKIRQATKEALRELNISRDMQMQCVCRRPAVAGGCRSCLQREICNRLLNLGYDSAICESKWKTSSEIPSGVHTYLEVIDKSNTKRGEVKVVIELNFRAEFEMACGNENYNKLVRRLPEVFVGKVERLRVLIKILCSAAKKCMKEKKMHLAPWRKHKYMQAKWLIGTSDRLATTLPVTGNYVRPPKPKASMLTCDLLENFSGLRCTVVEVV